jgi:RNA-binding protein YhbY
MSEMAHSLDATPINQIGKVLIIYRKNEGNSEQK